MQPVRTHRAPFPFVSAIGQLSLPGLPRNPLAPEFRRGTVDPKLRLGQPIEQVRKLSRNPAVFQGDKLRSGHPARHQKSAGILADRLKCGHHAFPVPTVVAGVEHADKRVFANHKHRIWEMSCLFREGGSRAEYDGVLIELGQSLGDGEIIERRLGDVPDRQLKPDGATQSLLGDGLQPPMPLMQRVE